MPFKYKPTNPESPHSKPLPTCPNHLGSYTLRTAPMPQSLLKLCKPSNLKPADPALPISSHRNHNKALVHSLPISLCPLTDLVVPCGLGTLSIKLSFQWKSFLIYRPYQTSNFLWIRYILEPIPIAIVLFSWLFTPLQSFRRYVHNANSCTLFGIYLYVNIQLY